MLEQTKADSELRSMYDCLTRGKQRRLKKESKKLDATKYAYLEEILIDYNNAVSIAIEAIYGLDFHIELNDLIHLLLLCGMGVAKRRADEISLISGESAEELKKEKIRLLDEYKDMLVDIYDVVMQDLEKTKNQNNKVMSL